MSLINLPPLSHASDRIHSPLKRKSIDICDSLGRSNCMARIITEITITYRIIEHFAKELNSLPITQSGKSPSRDDSLLHLRMQPAFFLQCLFIRYTAMSRCCISLKYLLLHDLLKVGIPFLSSIILENPRQARNTLFSELKNDAKVHILL